MLQRLNRSLTIIYLIDGGFVLMVIPWTIFWDRNFFVEASPLAQALLTMHAVRGGVSGVGLLTLATGVIEFVRMVQRREWRWR